MKNPPYINLDDFIIGFFGWKDKFFQQKIILLQMKKWRKKMQNLGETFFLLVTFSIMLSVMPLEQRLQGMLIIGNSPVQGHPSPCVKHRQKFILLFICQLS
jgi:hypothetical protein